MTTLYSAYAWLFWPVIAGTIVLNRSWAGMRCATVLAMGQLFMWGWFTFAMPAHFERQPSEVYLLVYVLSCFALTVRPSGKLCSIMAGLMLVGVALSIVVGTVATRSADMLFWQSQVLLGWATLIVLTGSAAGGRGRRILDRMRFNRARVADAAHYRGVA